MKRVADCNSQLTPAVIAAHAAGQRRRSGFTLVEMLIVIGIILFLMAIGVFGYRSLERSNSTKQTKIALASADGMVKEMNSVGAVLLIEGPADNSPPPVFQTGAATDAAVDTLASNTTKNALVMKVLLSNPKNKTAFQNFPAGMQLQKAGTVYDPPFIADAWNRPLVYVPSGGLTGVKNATGPALTVKSPSGRGFWASGGPDGDLTTGDDNVYSFQQ